LACFYLLYVGLLLHGQAYKSRMDLWNTLYKNLQMLLFNHYMPASVHFTEFNSSHVSCLGVPYVLDAFIGNINLKNPLVVGDILEFTPQSHWRVTISAPKSGK
jgi:hypothetical protein